MPIDSSKIELLKVATAGSVDDGKSTLIGRLFFDRGAIYEDSLEAIKKASAKKGMKMIDLSLLTDGLAAEREQKITIDVAYIHLSTPTRKFVFADVPGHEQYTKNMVTGVSGADVVMILADARKGLLIQSKRHLFISSLMKAPHILVVVNKMDMVGYSRDVFEKIRSDFLNFVAKLGINDIQFVPVSALRGDMVVNRGEKMNWHNGPTVFEYLVNLPMSANKNLVDFRLPVQYVLRPHQDFRGYAGKIESGSINRGEEIVVLPAGKRSRVKSIFIGNKEVEIAFAPRSVALTLEDELDISRGDTIVRKNNLPSVGNEIEAVLCWMSETPMEKGKTYVIKHTAKHCKCFAAELMHKINVENLHRATGDKLELNEVGKVIIKTAEPFVFDPYALNRGTGSFIIVDVATNNTVGAGIILKGTETRKLIDEQFIGKERKKGAVLWFTGFSGSGKTTLADAVFEKLERAGLVCEKLDGDILRGKLCDDLGFSKEDRLKNIERAAFVAELLSKHGVIVLASFISPSRDQRDELKKRIKNFVEIFVNAPLEICEKRDVKGLYKKARKGELKKFTGVSDFYEPPVCPHLELKTGEDSVEKCAERVVEYLRENKIF